MSNFFLVIGAALLAANADTDNQRTIAGALLAASLSRALPRGGA